MRRLKFFLMYEGVAHDSVGVSLSQAFFSLNYTLKKPVYCFISSRGALDIAYESPAQQLYYRSLGPSVLQKCSYKVPFIMTS